MTNSAIKTKIVKVETAENGEGYLKPEFFSDIIDFKKVRYCAVISLAKGCLEVIFYDKKRNYIRPYVK